MKTSAAVLIAALAAVPLAAQGEVEPGAEADGETRVIDQATLAAGAAGPVVIESVTYVDKTLLLVAEDGRRFRLPDGLYRTDDGIALTVQGGALARLDGSESGGACSIAPYALRLVDGRVSLIGEIGLPDGAYKRDAEVQFSVVEGRIVDYEGPIG